MARVEKGVRREEGRLIRWTAPRVTRLEAGAAENGSGPRHDDQVNYS